MSLINGTLDGLVRGIRPLMLSMLNVSNIGFEASDCASGPKVVESD